MEKCEHNGEYGNFCSNCGMQLKEKCPECGEMETIGRSICVTKVEKAKKELDEYKEKNVGGWRANIGFLSFVLVLLMGMALMIYLDVNSFKMIKGVFIFVVVAFGILLTCFNWQNKAGNKAEQEFLKLHPHYAEILKKAERGE